MDIMDIDNLPEKEAKAFKKTYHLKGYGTSFTLQARKLVGYYVKGNLRVKFYDKTPSWFSKKQMYWIHGWTWEDA